ncbi:DegT/DnrJ/EryC1/StrS family aminotransferase [Candidatus Woesearchaeota archaeon]|nr:DegT/DnrJ/EryC1/StrS family aminotransferase [Candidatus Woesearchaeota archaeon]
MAKLALLGGTPVRTKSFNYLPDFDNAEIDAVNKVMNTRILSGFHSNYRKGGPKIMEFEDNFAKFHQMKYAVAFNSGTSALHAALVALGIGEQDEVIVPSYTFTASASSILMCNATPIFCDVGRDTFNINTNNLESLITDKTKVILAVHLVGNPCDMTSIQRIASKYNLKVLEDCAQSPGAKVNNNFVGTIGDISAFSFVETKNMVTGEGGMVLTNDENYDNICRLVRSHGEILVEKGRSYLSQILGWNYRMTEIEAAIGIEQLKKLDYLNSYRIKNSDLLEKNINFDGLKPVKVLENTSSVKHVAAFTYDEQKMGVSRDLFLKALNAEGINADKGYPHPLYMNPIFLNHRSGRYKEGLNPISEDLCYKSAIWSRRIMYPNTSEDMHDIVEGFSKVIENIDELKSLKD